MEKTKEQIIEERNKLVERYASATREALLKTIERVSNHQIQSIKELDVSDEVRNKLINLSKDHSYYDRILVDALKKE